MKSKIAVGVMWLGAAKVIVNLLALLSTLVLARFLTPADFGLVAIGTTLLTIIGAVTDLSLASALVQRTTVEDAHFHTAWTLNIVRSVLVSMVFCAISPVVVYFYGDERLFGVLLWLSFSIFLTGFNNPKMVVLTRRLEFWQDFVQSVGQKLVGFVVGVGVAFLYQSYWALIAGALASQLSGVIVSYVVCPYRPRFALSKAAELWGFSVWLSLGQLVNILNWKFDHLLVGARLGQEALGHYSVGDNIAGMPTRELVAPIERTLFPGFARIGGDVSRLQKAYVSAQTMVCFFALPAGVGFAIIAQPLVLMAMGERWLPIVKVIEFVSVTVALQTVSSAAQPLAMAGGQTKMLFKRDLTSFCLRIPMIIVGLHLGGLFGLLVARAVSTIVSIGMNMYVVKTMIDLGFVKQLRQNFRSIVGVLAMAAVLILVKGALNQGATSISPAMSVLLLVPLGGLVYFGVSLVLWVFSGKPDATELVVLNAGRTVLRRVFRSSL